MWNFAAGSAPPAIRGHDPKETGDGPLSPFSTPVVFLCVTVYFPHLSLWQIKKRRQRTVPCLLVPPILATLGINELLTGLSIVMTGGAAVSTFPKQFCDAFSTNIGGVSPNGGKGRMSGVITALILLKLIESGIRRFRSVSDYYVTLIWGAVLLLALVLDYMSTKGRKAKA